MRKAISLVALVITIIALIVLTGATIMSVGKNGLISRAQEATYKNDIKTLEEALTIKIQNEKVEAEVAGDGRTEKINISLGQADYEEKMREVFPKLSSNMIGKLYVENDKLKINTDTSSPTKASETEINWFNETMAIATPSETPSSSTGYTVTIAEDFIYNYRSDMALVLNYYDGTTERLPIYQMWINYKGNQYFNVVSVTAEFQDKSMYITTSPTLSPDLYNLGEEREVTAVLTSDITVVAAGGQDCILAETLVTMADGTQKPIGDIVVGDYILSYDWETMELIPNKVIYASSQDDTKTWNAIRYYKRTYSDGTVIKNVYAHRFYNKEVKSFIYLERWNIGDHAYKMDGTFPELISCELVEEPCTYARITGELGTNYFANGFLTGNSECPQNISFEEVTGN